MQNTTSEVLLNNSIMEDIVDTANLSFNAEAALTFYSRPNGAGIVYISVNE
jgi:hypothetical protein